MDSIKNFWSDLSWLSNSFTIILGFITISGLYLAIKNWTIQKKENFRPYADMQSFIDSKINDAKNIKSKKIVIVDDQPEHYPLHFLQKSGFNVTPITSISLTNYKHLLDYDLIILDVTNIVEEDMKRGGLELMKRIKQDNPRKPVISASSKTYDPTLTDFFKLSDRQIQTPIKDQAIEIIITETLNKFYSPRLKAREVDEALAGKGLDQSQKSKVLKLGYSYINKKIDDATLIKSCAKITHRIDAHQYKSILDELSETL
ncbi:response regulator [Pseudomonas asplenii]|uniref:response regulator n=1 Tax=Pseudomonas asplenii TaxID=53407 RepID=UPI002234A1EE|nr:response regulator [Pseudomonas asplenii]UZE27479.1 response regulator [Pseudomonas asplenii]